MSNRQFLKNTLAFILIGLIIHFLFSYVLGTVNPNKFKQEEKCFEVFIFAFSYFYYWLTYKL